MSKKQTYKKKLKKDTDLTSFQKKVLDITLKIPHGETRTYAWVAKQLGSPQSIRAVGQALKKNPYAPHIPCHRVISSNGSIGGYSGGRENKIKLLRKEGIRI